MTPLLVFVGILGIVTHKWIELAAEAIWRAAAVRGRHTAVARWLREVVASRVALVALEVARRLAPPGSEVSLAVAAIWGDHIVRRPRQLQRAELAVLAPLLTWSIRLAGRALAAWIVAIAPTVNAAMASVGFGFFAALILAWTELPVHTETAVVRPAGYIAVGPELVVVCYSATLIIGASGRLLSKHKGRCWKAIFNDVPTRDSMRFVGLLILACIIPALVRRILSYPFEILPYAGLALLVVAVSARRLGGRLALASVGLGATAGTLSLMLLVAGQVAAAIAVAALGLTVVAGVSARRVRAHAVHNRTQVQPS